MNTTIRKKSPILASLAVLLIMGATLVAFIIPASAWSGGCSSGDHTTVLGTATIGANGLYHVIQGDPFTVDGSSHWCWGLFVNVPTPTTTVTDTKTKTATTTVTIPPTTVSVTATSTITLPPTTITLTNTETQTVTNTETSVVTLPPITVTQTINNTITSVTTMTLPPETVTNTETQTQTNTETQTVGCEVNPEIDPLPPCPTTTVTQTTISTVTPPSHLGTFLELIVLPNVAYSSTLPPVNAVVQEQQTSGGGLVTKTLTETSPIMPFSTDGGKTVYAAFYVADNNVLSGTTTISVTFGSYNTVIPFPTSSAAVPIGATYITFTSPLYGYYWETLT